MVVYGGGRLLILKLLYETRYKFCRDKPTFVRRLFAFAFMSTLSLSSCTPLDRLSCRKLAAMRQNDSA